MTVQLTDAEKDVLLRFCGEVPNVPFALSMHGAMVADGVVNDPPRPYGRVTLREYLDTLSADEVWEAVRQVEDYAIAQGRMAEDQRAKRPEVVSVGDK